MGAEDNLADAMRYLLIHTYQSRPLEPVNDEIKMLEEEWIGDEEIVDWGEGV